MKTKYDKIAKHIRRLNELLGVTEMELGHTYSDGNAITIPLLERLHRSEQDQGDYAFTSNAVDRAIEGLTESDF